MGFSVNLSVVRCLAIPEDRTRISESLRPFIFVIMKKVFTLIVLCVFSLCTIHAEITWTLSDDGTLTISGTGDMTKSFKNTQTIKNVIIEDGVISIGYEAFYGCENITSVIIGNSVTNVGQQAFYNCFNLKKITIGKSIKSIGKDAFRECYNIQSIIINNPEPPACEGLSIFACPKSGYVRDKYDVYTYATIHVPMGSKEDYSSAYEWRYFNKIKEDMEIDGKVYYAKLIQSISVRLEIAKLMP
jgi:hypothetical protein